MKNESILKGNGLFEKYVRKNIIKYILVLVIYVVGFVIGISIYNDKIEAEEELLQISDYVIDGMNKIGQTEEIKMDYIKQDIFETIIACIFSFSIIGIPIILVLLFLKAISLGITVSAVLYSSGVGTGMAFSLLAFLIPTMVKLLMVLILISSSLKFTQNVIVYKKETKYELVRHAIVNLFVVILLIINVLYRVFSLKIIGEII